MATSSKADSPGGVDQVTKSRICRDSFKEASEMLVEKISALNEHNGNSALHMYFGVPDDDYLSDDVLDTAAITHGKLHKTLRDALKHIKDDLCRKGEEVEEDTKTVTEAAEAMKTAKAEKSDKDSTDIHISILEKEMQNMQKSLEMLTEKIQEFCSSTKKEATNTESVSTPCGVNRRYSKQDLTALRVIEIQELQMEGVLCRKSRYKHGRTNWVKSWEKDNSNCWNVFQRKPKRWTPSSIADLEYFSQSHRFTDPRQKL